MVELQLWWALSGWSDLYLCLVLHEEFSSTLLKGHNGFIHGLASMAEFHLKESQVCPWRHTCLVCALENKVFLWRSSCILCSVQDAEASH
jgi:hypothetical protein